MVVDPLETGSGLCDTTTPVFVESGFSGGSGSTGCVVRNLGKLSTQPHDGSGSPRRLLRLAALNNRQPTPRPLLHTSPTGSRATVRLALASPGRREAWQGSARIDTMGTLTSDRVVSRVKEARAKHHDTQSTVIQV